MKVYLSRADSFLALKKMKRFHDELSFVMKENGFNILSNLGRRNILLSESQEKYFADVLSRNFSVRADGRTGEPDIMIDSLGKELECKLTSRHKTGTIAFQTDYETLSKKGSLDYLYVVANKAFDEFAVILYTDLTIKDFRPLSSGARGKTQLLKHAAHDRAHVLVGSMESVNKKELKKLSRKMSLSTTDKQRKKINKSIKYWQDTPTRFNITMEPIDA